MPPTAPQDTAIPVPDVDTDEPVAVIPTASVAPLDGPPDGERINTFTLAPKGGRRGRGAATLGGWSEGVGNAPLSSLAAAFVAGFLVARILR